MQQAQRAAWRLGVVILTWAAVAAPAPRAAAATVYLEDSPAAQELMDEAATLAEQQRFGEAAQRLQRVAVEYPDKLMPAGPSLYIDAGLRVRSLLLERPELLGAFRDRYAAEAQRALADVPTGDSGLPDPAGLARVVEGYGLTAAGLEASLTLAGVRLEQADAAGAAEALEGLDRHPDLAAQAVRYHTLAAAAALMAGDPEAAEMELSALRDAGPGAEPELAMLAALRELPNAVHAADAAEATLPPLDQPLWQTVLSDAVDGEATLDPGVEGDAQTMTPTAAGPAVVLSDGFNVVSLDRTSGRLRWSYSPNLARDDPAVDRRRRRFMRTLTEQRSVCYADGRIFAVVGFPQGWSGMRMTEGSTSSLVCLDAESGTVLWTLGSEQLESSIGNASLHGTPVWFDGRVLLMARRSQMAGFQDSYLLAVDGREGSVRWRRHLASTSGPGRRGETPSLSRMTLHGGRVYFTDTLGAAACVDARRGTVRWVRLLAEPDADQAGQPGETASPLSDLADPLVCDAGLILPLRLGDAAGLLLDPGDGRVLRRWATTDWPLNTVGYFLPVDGDVLAVGDRLARLDGETLEPVWVQEESSNALRDAGVNWASGGRVAVLGDRVLFRMAGANNLIGTLDLATGEPRARYETANNRNLVAAGDAVVASAGGRVAGYLRWEDAYERLASRIADDPRDLETALNMAQLAVNARRSDAVLEGVDAALTGLATLTAAGDVPEAELDRTRQRVVDELLSLAERPDAVEPAVVEALFQRLGATTRTPGELVAFNLAFGRYNERAGRVREAAAAYQSILADDALAAATFEQHGRSRRGDLAARQALVDLVEQHGPEVYAPFEEEASQRLARLQLAGDPSAEELRSLADRYPLAAASAEALYTAAELLSQDEQHAAAVVPYRRAFSLARSDELKARVAGALTRYYVQHGRPDDAARWLAFVAQAAPDLQPIRDGAAVELRPWLDGA